MEKPESASLTIIMGMTLTSKHRGTHNKSKELSPGCLGLCVIVTNKLIILRSLPPSKRKHTTDCTYLFVHQKQSKNIKV